MKRILSYFQYRNPSPDAPKPVVSSVHNHDDAGASRAVSIVNTKKSTKSTRSDQTKGTHIQQATQVYVKPVQVPLDYKLFLKCFIHELKTPLQTIHLALQLLEQEDQQLQENELIQDIGGAVTFMDEVISNFGMVQEASIQLHPFRPCSLKRLFRDTVALLPLDEWRNRVYIETFIHQDVYDYNYMDEPHIKQVLLNLLKNAVKYQSVGESVMTKNVIVVTAKPYDSSDTNSILELQITRPPSAQMRHRPVVRQRGKNPIPCPGKPCNMWSSPSRT